MKSNKDNKSVITLKHLLWRSGVWKVALAEDAYKTLKAILILKSDYSV